MNKGFFGRLFDFKFTEFITPSIITIIFWVGVILAGLWGVVAIVSALANAYIGVGQKVITVLLTPVGVLLGIIFLRIYLELVMVLFRIMGLLEGIAKDKGATPAAPAASAPFSSPPPPPPAATH